MVKESQSKANSYESELAELRKSEALASSEHSALLKRIEDLQSQLATVSAERDKLKLDLSTVATPQPHDAAHGKDGVLDAESRLTQQQAAGSGATYVTVPENSVRHLSGAPWNGRFALAVGNIEDEKQSLTRVYIFMQDGQILLPDDFHDDEKRAQLLLTPWDRFLCFWGPASPHCLEVQKSTYSISPITNVELVFETFTFGGYFCTIRATRWNSNPDSIDLALNYIPKTAPKHH